MVSLKEFLINILDFILGIKFKDLNEEIGNILNSILYFKFLSFFKDFVMFEFILKFLKWLINFKGIFIKLQLRL